MLRLSLILLCFILLLGSCAKNNSTVTPEDGFITLGGGRYATAKIGTQTWTTMNYNGFGGVNYNNSAANDPVYGKLYNYGEATAIVLPAGWRLPSRDDYNTLLANIGGLQNEGYYYGVYNKVGLRLLAQSTWTKENGSDSSHFDAVAAGYTHGTEFNNLGSMAVFLSTTKYPTGQRESLQIYQAYNPDSYVFFIGLNSIVPDDDDRGSIRFVKDN